MLAGIGAIQKRFLRGCSLTKEDALLFFNLAPLAKRNDIAMLGLINRSVLRCGPRHIASMFQLAPPSTSQKHCWYLQSHRGSRHQQKLVRSTLGLTDVYNLLPAWVVQQRSVATKQHDLPCLLKCTAANREDGWLNTWLNIRCTISLDPVVERIWPCPTVVVVDTTTSFAWKIREHQERTSETSAKVTVRNGWSLPVAQLHPDLAPNQLCWPCWFLRFVVS